MVAGWNFFSEWEKKRARVERGKGTKRERRSNENVKNDEINRGRGDRGSERETRPWGKTTESRKARFLSPLSSAGQKGEWLTKDSLTRVCSYVTFTFRQNQSSCYCFFLLPFRFPKNEGIALKDASCGRKLLSGPAGLWCMFGKESLL